MDPASVAALISAMFAAADAAVEFQDAIDIGLNAGARVDGAGTQLNFVSQLFGFELFVTLERNPVDDRVLGHRDEHHTAILVRAQGDVGEQAGTEQVLQRGI